MTAQQYFRRHWAGCAPVADLVDSLAAAAAEEHVAPAAAEGYRPHLGAGALEAALASGNVMRVRRGGFRALGFQSMI